MEAIGGDGEHDGLAGPGGGEGVAAGVGILQFIEHALLVHGIGQHGGQRSAALLVYEAKPFAHVDLRVDVHDEPVVELRRVFNVYRPAIPYYNLRQVDARVPPLDDWLRGQPR